MGRATPRSDLSADLNKLIAPASGKNNQKLQPRLPREPIVKQQGSGREGVAVGEGGGDASNMQGVLKSSDGMFVIYYDYHEHAE